MLRLRRSFRKAAMVLVGAQAMTGMAGGGAVELKPFVAEYRVKALNISVGLTRLQLKAEGDGVYVYESRAETSGLARIFSDARANEYSRLIIRNGVITPLEYRFTLVNGDENKNYSVNFDWDRNLAKIFYKGRHYRLDVPPGTIDAFAIRLAVMRDLIVGREKLEYQAVERRRLKKYVFRRIGEEEVQTPAGTFKTVVIQSVKQKPKESRVTTFWCAPQLQYLPVKGEQTKYGDRIYSMLLEKVSISEN